MKYNIINSDVYSGLSNLTDNSIDVAITSPPYWGQRDYGFNGQIGNESDYQVYIDKLVCIFNVLRNKLADTGVFFLNIGDKYISKYGKSPLGFIPFKLAYFMQKDGWILNDIIIWYKPNHMPSSIKNRFTNSYEPVFVFSKSENNIYNQQIEKTNDNSNILKIPLQPTPFKHVAVYPEKLVLELLKKVDLPEKARILDPFAGSGTTLKVVKDFFKNASSIMIEANDKYINIIKERCKLNGEVEINKLDFIPYFVKQNRVDISADKKILPTHLINGAFKKRTGLAKIFENKNEYYNILEQFFDQTFKVNFNNNATFFIGCREFDNELIYNTSQLNSRGWIIRNMIVIEENNRWFPVFMIVDDNKKVDYIFNYKSLNLKSKNEYKRNWNDTNFIGFKVIDSVSKMKRQGKVVEILEKYENGFPKYGIIEWEDNTFTKEFMVLDQESINKNLILNVGDFIFDIIELENYTVLDKQIDFQKNKESIEPTTLFNFSAINNYNGKFKDEKRINFGASPGARSSTDEEYFSLQRLYEVDQKLIADYLNRKRKQKGLSKQELTNCFPTEYKHTVGHWLRKDFGGSLPTPEDWRKLCKILNIEGNITNYVCKTALRIQTVKHSEYKMPSDFQQNDFIEKLELLNESRL
ncbi:MAG: site-specific DNA-methyltransferase [Chloroherpetonaceae bacterium]